MKAHPKTTLLTQHQQQRFFEASLYTDSDLLPQEQQHIFRQTWLYVGDASCLSEPGTVLVCEVAGCSLLIVRNHDGSLNAFHNICPHRASLLCAEPGIHQLKRFVCPYHAWVYSLDGQLLGTPAQEQFPESFRLEDFPLKSVRCQQWEGFLFVCLNPHAPPLQQFLGNIPASISGYRTEATKLLVKKQYEVACNWKVYHDNTLCDYHVPFVHRNTLNVVQGPVRFYEHYFDKYVNLLYTPTTKHWREENPVLEHLGERCRYGFFTYGIFPNLHLLAMPNGVLAWIRIDSLTVNTCQVNLEIYGIPGFSPSETVLEKEFEAFMREDMEITEGVQQGYESGAYTPGVANGLEARIIHQQQLIHRFLWSGTE